jgi:hypothetical protein
LLPAEFGRVLKGSVLFITATTPVQAAAFWKVKIAKGVFAVFPAIKVAEVAGRAMLAVNDR